MPFDHRDVGDVRRPHLVQSLNSDVAQQIRVDLVLGVGLAHVRLRANSLQAHIPNQALHALARDRLALASQLEGYLAGAEEGAFSVDAVDLRLDPFAFELASRRLGIDAAKCPERERPSRSDG